MPPEAVQQAQHDQGAEELVGLPTMPPRRTISTRPSRGNVGQSSGRGVPRRCQRQGVTQASHSLSRGVAAAAPAPQCSLRVLLTHSAIASGDLNSSTERAATWGMRDRQRRTTWTVPYRVRSRMFPPLAATNASRTAHDAIRVRLTCRERGLEDRTAPQPPAFGGTAHAKEVSG